MLEFLSTKLTLLASDINLAQLPATRCELKQAAQPIGDLVIGLLLGVVPYLAIAVAIILALALVAVAAFEQLRARVSRALVAVLVAGVIASALIGLVFLLLKSPC
jgi:hypothetical protein